jgi:hypothetical protein
MINKWPRYFLILLLGLLSGCWLTQKDSVGNASNHAELLRSGVYGTRTLQESSASWITNRMALVETISNLDKHQIESGGELPEIDFEIYGILLLEMGQRPTGGYAINFDSSLSYVVDKKVVIHVILKPPAEGMVVTQAVTSPFMLLKIRHVDITSISVLDQNEQALFELFIP